VLRPLGALLGPLGALAALTASAAVMPVSVTVTAAASTAAAATRAGEEPCEERMELGHPILRHDDCDLLVL
jgi:hypothetical protein